MTGSGTILDTVTPGETALLFADRVIPSGDRKRRGSMPAPVSGRWVDQVEHQIFTLTAAVGALVSAGAVSLFLREDRDFLGTAKVIWLSRTDRPVTWPVGSPEARLLQWLEGRPLPEDRLENAASAVFLPRNSDEGIHLALASFGAGLVTRGIANRVATMRWLVFPSATVGLKETHRPTFDTIDPAAVEAKLMSAGAAVATHAKAIADAWRLALIRSEQVMSPGL